MIDMALERALQDSSFVIRLSTAAECTQLDTWHQLLEMKKPTKKFMEVLKVLVHT